MKRISIDREWQFYSDKCSGVKNVDLPHDFIIGTDVDPNAPSGTACAYYNGGIGYYEKTIHVPSEWAGKKIILEFDGSYGVTTVYCNKKEIVRHPHGYAPFHADLTDCLKESENCVINVTVDNSAQPNSRWYSGAGLYRHVDLLVGEPAHIAPWGIFAHTERIENGAAYVTVEVTVYNGTDTSGEFRVQAKLGDASAKRAVHIEKNSSSVCRLRLIVPDAKLWDTESPNLYSVDVCLEDINGNVIDSDSVAFGIRTISADVKNGFMLNGRTLKLKGACVHHDNGILGAASFYDSEYRKLSLLKNNGFNAVRSAHNPPSRDMLKVCDELGLVVIDEAFDMWNLPKNACDYHLYFKDYWEMDMESFILRDRNHPSVVIWSIGNEVEERGGANNGYEVARQLAEKVRALDPTRYVTAAVCVLWGGSLPESAKELDEKKKEIELSQGIDAAEEFWNNVFGRFTETFAAPLDIIGYNYKPERYENDGTEFPDRIICGTESFPKEIDRVWDKVEKLPYVIGDFTWTGFDYIGEVGIGKAVYTEAESDENPDMSSPYPWRLANDSDFDICGFDRPQLHYRKIVWGSEETYIAARYPENFGKKETVSAWGWPACENHWTWNGYEGKPTQVDVYSAADEVELILNGESLGRKPAGKENRYTAKFNLRYIPGKLTAVSYKSGTEISRDELVTAGMPATVRAKSNVTSLPANGHSLAFVTAEIVDSEGRRVPDAEIPCEASVEGEGTLAAFGVARPVTDENYTVGRFTSYQGRVLAVVRSGWKEGTVSVKISVKDLGEETVTLQVE